MSKTKNFQQNGQELINQL